MKMSKTAAIKWARSKVSGLSKIGDNWTFIYDDEERAAWINAGSFDYWRAKQYRSAHLIYLAVCYYTNDSALASKKEYEYLNNLNTPLARKWTKYI